MADRAEAPGDAGEEGGEPDVTDVELKSTKAWIEGRASVWQCMRCGSIVYIPDGGKPWICPVGTCFGNDWKRQRVPVGPFEEVGT